MATKSKGLNSPLMRKFRALQRAKRMYCKGKATQTQVNKAADAYVTAAVAKGQTATAAQQKANRVKKAGCSMSSSIAKRKRTVRKRKITTTRRRKAA